MVYVVRCNVTHWPNETQSKANYIVGVFKSYNSALDYIYNNVRARETSCGFYTRTEVVKDKFSGEEVFEYEYRIFECELMD